jgi:hypothetical protein
MIEIFDKTFVYLFLIETIKNEIRKQFLFLKKKNERKNFVLYNIIVFCIDDRRLTKTKNEFQRINMFYLSIKPVLTSNLCA